MAVYYLHRVCRRVTLYGMGTVNVPDVPYHYFAGVGSRKKGNPVHSFDAESALLDALAWENRVEHCKYRTRDIVAHGTQVLSNLKTTLPLFQQSRYHNRFCGWNLCNRRAFTNLGRMVKDARDINFRDCRKIMYEREPLAKARNGTATH